MIDGELAINIRHGLIDELILHMASSCLLRANEEKSEILIDDSMFEVLDRVLIKGQAIYSQSTDVLLRKDVQISIIENQAVWPTLVSDGNSNRLI